MSASLENGKLRYFLKFLLVFSNEFNVGQSGPAGLDRTDICDLYWCINLSKVEKA